MTTMAGAKHRVKGNRIEREIVALHQEIGIEADRVPLSGASHYQGSGHDVDIYPFGRDWRGYRYEVKARKAGNGFRMLDRWVENAEGLFLRSDRSKPLVVHTWETYDSFLREIRRLQEQVERMAAAVRACGIDMRIAAATGEQHVGEDHRAQPL
jgi:hypothetical protein